MSKKEDISSSDLYMNIRMGKWYCLTVGTTTEGGTISISVISVNDKLC